MADDVEGPASGFVDAIVKDPNQIPVVKLIQGFPGAASGEGKARIYLSPDLSCYVEVPLDAILHREAIPASGVVLASECLWVNADADVTHGRSRSSFLSGAIQQEFAIERFAVGTWRLAVGFVKRLFPGFADARQQRKPNLVAKVRQVP